jgi:hypothetical protein
MWCCRESEGAVAEMAVTFWAGYLVGGLSMWLMLRLTLWRSRK